MHDEDHMSPEDIWGFLEGDLAEHHAEAVLAHLDVCGACVTYLADVVKAARPIVTAYSLEFPAEGLCEN